MTRPPDSSDPTIITRGLRTSPVVAEPDEPTRSIVPATTSGIEAATSGIDAATSGFEAATTSGLEEATSPGFEAAATSSGIEATTSDPASDRRFDATEAGSTSTPQPASAWTVHELSPEWTSSHEPVGSTEQKPSPDWTSPEWTSPVAAGPSTSAWPEAAAGPVPDVSDHAYDATAYRPYEQTYSATQIRTDHSDVGYGGPSGYDGYAAPDVYPGGGSDVRPAAGPDLYAGAGPDPYAGAGPGPYAGGLPPGYAGGAPPPQPGRSRGSIVAIALTAVVVIAIVGVAYYIVAGTGGGTSGTTAGPRNGSTDITACATAPSGTVTELRPQTELTAVLSVRAGCDSGDVLSSPDTRITLRSGSALVAAASFDLSRSPVAIGDAATLTVVFPADSSYVIRKALPSASAVTVEIAGAGGSTREASTAVSAVSLTGGRRALPPGTDGDAAAASALSGLIMSGESPAAQELGERWVPQLSAKRVGLFADGRTWTSESILEEIRSLDARFGGVYLLDSSRWPVFDSGGWFVTVAAIPFSTPDSVLSWCRQQSFDADHCFAKRLSKSGGSAGSSKYQ